MYAISVNQLDLLKVAGSYVNRKGWVHNGRKLSTNIFVCIEDGDCVFRMNGKEHYLQKNDYIIVPQNTFYSPYTADYCRHWFGHFCGDYMGEITSTSDMYKSKESYSRNMLYLPERGKADSILLSYLDEILAVPDSNYQCNSFRRNLAFLNALNYVGTMASGIENLSAQKIKHYIMQNLHKDISLADIASHFGYTKQYVIRVFKKSYFVTPARFIIAERLEHAKMYLAETTLKINEIAEKCGFSDANYFSRMFRNSYSISPHKYRRQTVGTDEKTP